VRDLIKLIDERYEFATLEDGYVYWIPTFKSVKHSTGGTTTGLSAISSAVLRQIADELDKRNAAWDKQIQEDPRI